MRLAVGIAGVRFDFDLPDNAAARATERYHSFMGAPGPAHYHMAIRGGPGAEALRRSLGPLTGRAALRGSRLVVEGAEAMGALDLGSGQGQFAEHDDLFALDTMIRAVLTLDTVKAGGCLCHAAAPVVDGRAHLCPGKSGSGKTTLASLARDALTDEIAIVLPEGEGWAVHGTPFWTGRPGSAPLAALYELGWDSDEIAQRPQAAGARHLLTNLALFVEDPATWAAAFQAAGRIAASVPFRRLRFTPRGDIDSLLQREARAA